MNSVLRMHQARHRTLNQGLLDLKRLYWNAREFRGGERRGRCPYEHLGLQRPSYRFWDLLEGETLIALGEAKARARDEAAGGLTEGSRGRSPGLADRAARPPRRRRSPGTGLRARRPAGEEATSPLGDALSGAPSRE